MKYIALICARGGSKGLPGKNIKPLNGVPLIGWSIMVAKQVERISRVIVSTDSEEIAKIALEYGAEVPFMRPNELAQD
ncbi:MAG: acylneuraminate cytidylyltransferase family protein, partial [Candidatus Marinimicrobia bacterium]|nr:acylneuraminate cytidylyltransferase family protein [Candidatus Neomarinimicrobiota bacterium]